MPKNFSFFTRANPANMPGWYRFRSCISLPYTARLGGSFVDDSQYNCKKGLPGSFSVSNSVRRLIVKHLLIYDDGWRRVSIAVFGLSRDLCHNYKSQRIAFLEPAGSSCLLLGGKTLTRPQQHVTPMSIPHA